MWNQAVVGWHANLPFIFGVWLFCWYASSYSIPLSLFRAKTRYLLPPASSEAPLIYQLFIALCFLSVLQQDVGCHLSSWNYKFRVRPYFACGAMITGCR